MEHRRLSDDGSANCKRWCRGANTRPRLCPWEGKQGSCRGEEPGEGSDPSHSACRASPAAPPAAGHRLDTAPSTLQICRRAEKKVLSYPREINWT